MAATFTLIASNTLSSAQASVTFSSIPQTYTDLVLRWSAGNADWTFSMVTFNSDTATNYSRTRLTGTGTAAASQRQSSQAQIESTYFNAITADTFSNGELYIPTYTSTANKAIGYFSVYEDNATNAGIAAIAALYQGSSAISTITITGYSSSNFVAGSSFFLYGLKSS